MYCCCEEGDFCPKAPQVMSNCEILQFDNQHIWVKEKGRTFFVKYGLAWVIPLIAT